MTDTLSELKSQFLTDQGAEDELRHVGVKGMRWGHRKAESSDSSGSSDAPTKPKKLTRKEVKAEKNEFYQKKGADLVEKALKDPTVLIKLHHGGTYPTLVTGKEFVDHLSRGGLMDIRATDVFATKAKSGVYERNENPNPKFQRSDRT